MSYSAGKRKDFEIDRSIPAEIKISMLPTIFDIKFATAIRNTYLFLHVE